MCKTHCHVVSEKGGSVKMWATTFALAAAVVAYRLGWRDRAHIERGTKPRYWWTKGV